MAKHRRLLISLLLLGLLQPASARAFSEEDQHHIARTMGMLQAACMLWQQGFLSLKDAQVFVAAAELAELKKLPASTSWMAVDIWRYGVYKAPEGIPACKQLFVFPTPTPPSQ